MQQWISWSHFSLPKCFLSQRTGLFERFPGDLPKAEAYFAATMHFSFFILWGLKENPRVQVGCSREKEGHVPMEY